MIPRTLFAEEHELFREQVRRFIVNEITPYHADWEDEGIVPRSLWRKAGEAGLLCTEVPEEYGGAGGDFLFGAVPARATAPPACSRQSSGYTIAGRSAPPRPPSGTSDGRPTTNF